MTHYEFQDIVESMLPAKVYGYYGRPASPYRIIFTDQDLTVKYFEKHYTLTNGLESILEEVLEDVSKFIIMWNSPLYEALS